MTSTSNTPSAAGTLAQAASATAWPVLPNEVTAMTLDLFADAL